MKDAITSDRSSIETSTGPVGGEDAEQDDGRGEDLSGKRGFQKKLGELYSDVRDGFVDKKERQTAIERFWRIYNCQLTTNQAYSGNSQIYLPIVRDAIDARVQRFINTLFPDTGRYADLVTYPESVPNGILGLLDHYVRRSNLRQHARELLKNGEVEGQYSLYVDWINSTRYVTKKVLKHPEIEPGVHDPEDTYHDVEDEEVVSQHPIVHVISDNDLVVLPATLDDIETAPNATVALKHYFTEDGLRAAVRDKLFANQQAAELALEQCQQYDPTNTRNTKVQNTEAAGVRVNAGRKEYIVFEAWRKFKIKGKLRWCRAFFGSENLVLGFTVNPNWNDRCPILSRGRSPISGSFWSKSPVDAVEQLQYMANDWMNMAQDSGQYSLLPIVMTDPEKNPNYASMIMSLAAVWMTNPNDTKFVEFPQLWKDALQFVTEARSQIMQAFGLNPAMVAMGLSSSKNTQAAIAQEQLVSLANITDEVQTLEDSIFTPLLQFFFELDQQFRDDDISVPIYGQMGIAAQRETVPPQVWDDRFEFKWRGSEVVRSQQQNQQMIAGLNILGKMGPALPNGKKIDVAPIIETIVQNIYGPRLSARVIIDQSDQLTVPAELENQILMSGMPAEVHPGDNDVEHLKAHMQALQGINDPTGSAFAQLTIHIQKTQAQMQAKAQAAQMQQMGGQPGMQQGPGPRPGAVPGPPRGGQGPPGMVHADQMSDPSMMPRNPA